MVDSRLPEPGDSVRRRRECGGCGERFTTHERAEAVSLGVRKRDGRREAYDRQKLLAGLMRAVTKRPVTVPELEAVADSIEDQVRHAGGETGAEAIGELALRALVRLDRVAAIRFASVYRNFEGLEEFEAELRRVEAESAPDLAHPAHPAHPAPEPAVDAQPERVAEPLSIGPVVDGADPSPVPSGSQGSIRRSPAAGPPQPGTTKRRAHAE